MADVTVYRLVDGDMVPDTIINPTNIPTTDQKESFPAGATALNLLITDDDPRLTDARTPIAHGNAEHTSTFITTSDVTYGALDANGDVGVAASTVAAGDDARFLTSDQHAGIAAAPNAITGANPATDKTYVDNLVDGLEWAPSVHVEINYLKTDAGAPSGTPSAGEKCLNTNEDKLYQESALAWDSGTAITTGDRFVFRVDGTDTTGNSGTYTADDKIREYNGATYDITDPASPQKIGLTYNLDEDGLDYRWSGTVWIVKSSTVSHNNLSTLQGGDSANRWHLDADEYNAVNAADTPTTTNKMLVRSNAAALTTPVTFSRDGGMGQTQTDLTMYMTGKRAVAVMPKAGYIVSAVLQCSEACTAGTASSKIQKNAVDITPTDLDLGLNSTTNTTKDYASVAYGTTDYDFAAGDELSVDLDTDGSWATATDNEAVTQEIHVAFV